MSQRVAGNVAIPRTIDQEFHARERARTDLPALERGVYQLAREMRDQHLFLYDRAGWNMAVSHVVELMFDDEDIAGRVEQRRAEIRAFFSPRGAQEEKHFTQLCRARIRNEMRAEAECVLTRVFIAERRLWRRERARMLVDTGQSEADDVPRKFAVDWEYDQLLAEDIAALKPLERGREGRS
ncbi:hypothetical protein C27AD_09761 [Salinisphaera hydrothermalis C27AD]